MSSLPQCHRTESDNGATTREEHSKTSGPRSTSCLRTLHSIHKDVIPIPSKPPSTTTVVRGAENTRPASSLCQGPDQTPAEACLAFQNTRNPGQDCVCLHSQRLQGGITVCKSELRAAGSTVSQPSIALKGLQEQTFKAPSVRLGVQIVKSGPGGHLCAGWRACPLRPGVAITSCKLPNSCPHMYTSLC